MRGSIPFFERRWPGRCPAIFMWAHQRALIRPVGHLLPSLRDGRRPHHVLSRLEPQNHPAPSIPFARCGTQWEKVPDRADEGLKPRAKAQTSWRIISPSHQPPFAPNAHPPHLAPARPGHPLPPGSSPGEANEQERRQHTPSAVIPAKPLTPPCPIICPSPSWGGVGVGGGTTSPAGSAWAKAAKSQPAARPPPLPLPTRGRETTTGKPITCCPACSHKTTSPPPSPSPVAARNGRRCPTGRMRASHHAQRLITLASAALCPKRSPSSPRPGPTGASSSARIKSGRGE